MGVNAPPLYDACLIGRWEDVLAICNQQDNHSHGGGGSSEGEQLLGDGSNTTEVTMGCSSSGDEEGEHNIIHDKNELTLTWEDTAPILGTIREGNDDDEDEDGAAAAAINDADAANSEAEQTSNPATLPNHPCIQTRYVDRRRNTPLHLACRRQPPPSVIRALLNHSPCEAVSRRTADGLTPLHFAAYCGAGVEVVSMLVDRMRSDSAVRRAMRLSVLSSEDEESRINGGENDNGDDSNHNDGKNSSNKNSNGTKSRNPGRSNVEENLPPTRLLDRRLRTPLHCACAGFRTSTRPAIVRKLLSVDPGSATLMDERGRTPFSLLFDDYAEEVMEALEEDVTPKMVRDRIKKGGELHECWKMLHVLLQAAYKGNVAEDDEGGGTGVSSESKASLSHPSILLGIKEEYANGQRNGSEEKKDSHSSPTTSFSSPVHHVPQTKEVNNLDCYDQQNFSIVHAAAGVWECPAPLAKLVLKCICGKSQYSFVPKGSNSMGEEDSNPDLDDDDDDESDWNMDNKSSNPSNISKDVPAGYKGIPIIRQPDEDNMRLPLHIAVCARPQGERGILSTRFRFWLSSSEASSLSRGFHGSISGGNGIRGRRSQSFTSGVVTIPSNNTPSGTGPIRTASMDGQVYNPRFGRSPSHDGIQAFQHHQGSFDGSNHGISSSVVTSLNNSLHSVSSTVRASKEPFLRHTMVRDILALYPTAASVVDDRTGKLPIVLAIENGKSWETAVGPLLEAYPKPFGGGGDGGAALADDSDESLAHRKALHSALISALSGPEEFVREQAQRTAGKLAKWGGIWGMPRGLDGIVSECLDTVINEGGVDDSAKSADWVRTQASLLMGVAEIVYHSRPDVISDSVARLCLYSGREFLFAKDGYVREAAARVLGAALESGGDADDAATVMREVVLNTCNEEGSVCSGAGSVARTRDDDAIVKHGKLLACTYVVSTKWGSDLMANKKEIRDGIVTLLRRRVRDKNTVVRSWAYRAMGPVLGKSPVPEDPNVAATTATLALKEMRGYILKGTRATEQVEVQLSLARGLISASKIHPGLFLCKAGMPIIDAALMLAMSSSTARPSVQKAFQIFLWVALELGKHGLESMSMDTSSDSSFVGTVPAGLEKYISLAEGENGRIMMNFVTRTLAKIENVDDQF